MILTFRQSEFSGSKRCLRSWALGYRRRLIPKREKVSTAGTGTLVHKGLEFGYNGELWLPAVTELWKAESLKYGIDDQAEYAKQFTLAKIILEGYWDWVSETSADVGWEVTGVERNIEVEWPRKIDGHTIIVTGKVDLEVLDFGQPKLVDHKTRDSIKQTTADTLDEQRPTYAVLRKLEDGTEYLGATHNILRRVKRTATAKPPFYHRNELHYSIEQLRRRYLLMDRQLERLVPLAARIEDGTIELDDPDLPPTPGTHCDWACRFTSPCALMQDSSDWQYLIDNGYNVGDPLTEEEA